MALMDGLMRTGRKLSQVPAGERYRLCTLYLVVPGDDRDADLCIGQAATPELAEWIVASVNAGAMEPPP